MIQVFEKRRTSPRCRKYALFTSIFNLFVYQMYQSVVVKPVYHTFTHFFKHSGSNTKYPLSKSEHFSVDVAYILCFYTREFYIIFCKDTHQYVGYPFCKFYYENITFANNPLLSKSVVVKLTPWLKTLSPKRSTTTSCVELLN
jgi:hypothetical protein